jgi:hypothetical protein
MTDPTAPQPLNPSPPDFAPVEVPEENPAPAWPADPGDDRPYDAATSRGPDLNRFD